MNVKRILIICKLLKQVFGVDIVYIEGNKCFTLNGNEANIEQDIYDVSKMEYGMNEYYIDNIDDKNYLYVNDGRGIKLVVGPFLISSINDSGENINTKILSISEIDNIAVTAISLLKNQQIEQIKCVKHIDDKEKITRIKPEIIPYSEVINMVFEIEKELSHAVQEGRTFEAITHMEKLMSFKLNKGLDTLDHFKRYAMIFSSNLRKTIIAGGVTPIEAIGISDTFVKDISGISSIVELKKRIYLLVEDYCKAVESSGFPDCSKIMKDICQYVKVHYGESISTKTLADLFHINPSHLSRQFKKEVKMTVTEYIQHARIEEAKFLIKLGKYTMTEIAGLVGFNDSQYFSNVFKKVEGITPRDFS